MMLNRSRSTEQEKKKILHRCGGLERHRFYNKLKRQLKIVAGSGLLGDKRIGGGANSEQEVGEDDAPGIEDGSKEEMRGRKMKG